MKSLILALLVSFSFAKTINSVVAVIDDDVITEYELQKYKTSSVSKGQLVNTLIQKKIEEKLIKKFNIKVSEEELDEYISLVAASNHISGQEYLNSLVSKGISVDEAKNNFEFALKKRKLHQQIVQANIDISAEDVKTFYDQHVDDFTSFDSVKVLKYTSNNKKLLQTLQSTPMFYSADISKEEVIYSQKENPKLFSFVAQAKVDSFTPIIKLEDWSMFYILETYGQRVVKFEDVKNKIFAKIVDEKSGDILQDYFSKQRDKMNIRVVN